MQWLEAALAFSVIMMLLSTLVSSIVELIQRSRHMRQNGLEKLMVTLYQDVIVPRLGSDATRQLQSPEEFAQAMVMSRYTPKSWYIKYTALKDQRLAALTPLEFIERLATTPAGSQIYSLLQTKGEDYSDVYLGDLLNRFEEYGEHAREFFQKRAAIISGVVAVFVAFALNINAITIFNTFVIDKDIRTQVISQGESVAKNLEQQLKKQSTTQYQVFTEEEVKKHLQDVQNLRDQLTASNIPMGWERNPFQLDCWHEQPPGNSARESDPSEPENAVEKKDCDGLNVILSIAYWFIITLSTGILIGLGGPFWFNTYKKLFALTSAVTGMQSTAPDNTTTDGPKGSRTDWSQATKLFIQASRAKEIKDEHSQASQQSSQQASPQSSQQAPGEQTGDN